MKLTFAKKMEKPERIERCRALTDLLVDHTRGLLAASENNAVVLYSDTLSRQIPQSFAANAFNELQRSMHYFFLVRLSALWDKPAPDRESLPTLVALLDDPGVRESFADDRYRYHSTLATPHNLSRYTDPVEDEIIADYWARERVRRAVVEKSNVERQIAFAVRIVPRVEHCFVAPHLRPFRDSYIAHNLDAAVASKKEPLKLRYGDETKLLNLTIRIVDRLHLAINGTSFAWDMAREDAKRNAEELWASCKFNLIEE